jgi:predicted TIM-barrel fold metal-dependent hydrolase
MDQSPPTSARIPSWLIDAHSHLGLDTAAAQAPLLQAGGRVLNICIDYGGFGGLDAQRECYRSLFRDKPEQYAWCTSFSLANFGRNDWALSVNRQLDLDFAAGACACKTWKNVGMELRDPATERFVFPDDPRLDAVYGHVADARKPMLMHIAEPLACWRPLDPASPHYSYYKDNPQWHFYNRTDVPGHAELIQARDRVIEKHPGLTVVGAHFGSLEYDADELAARFARFPNFFVDTSARLGDAVLLALRNRDAFRNFMIEYAERILWGVDFVLPAPASTLAPDAQAAVAANYIRSCEREWMFYATGEPVTVGVHCVRGLDLPEDVVKLIFRDNARRIYFDD